MPITRRRTPGRGRPAIHEVAEEDALRPGRRARQPARRSARSGRLDHVAQPSEQRRAARRSSRGCRRSCRTGRARSRRSIQSGCALDRDRVDLLLRRQDVHRGGSPRARRPRSDRRSCLHAGGGRRAGRTARSGRLLFRSWQSRSGRSRTIATGRTWCLRASAISGLRASLLHVGRVDHGQPAAGQPLARRCSGAPRTRRWWRRRSFSSSDTRPRQKSEESDLGRLEVPAREGDLPEPDAPISTTRRELGNRRRFSHGVNTAICVGAPDLRVVRADRQDSATRVAEARRRRSPAQACELGARPLEAVVAVAEACPAGRPAKRTLYSTFGRGQTTVPGRANSNSTRSKAARRGGSRCSITSTTAAAS